MPIIRRYRKLRKEFVDIIVDQDDFDKISKLRLDVLQNGGGKIYIYVKDEHGRPISLQRYIKTPQNYDHTVDHINRNTLDYRKENLRILTNSKNNINRIMKNRHARPFIYPGVRLCEDGLYEARLNLDKKLILRKKFKQINDAINARKDAESRCGIIWSVTSDGSPDFVKNL